MTKIVPNDGFGGMRRPVALLASGTIVAFVIGYASKIVLLRLYSPADFGVFDVVIAAVATLLPVASLRYEDAMVLPEDPEEARDLFVLSAWLSAAFILAVAAASAAMVAFPVVRPEFVPPGAAPWILSVPILLFVLRASKLFELWLTRTENYARLAGGNVTQAGVTTVVRIAAGLMQPTPGGLLGGFVVGQGAAAAVYATRAAADLRAVPGRATWTRIRAAARAHRRFAIYSTPATLVAALVTRLPFFFLLFYFSAEVVGLFGQAFNVLYVPISLVASAFGQVFFVKAAQAAPRGELGPLAAKVHERLVLWALFPVIVTGAAAPDVFSILFSEPWRAAGEYAGILSGWILLTAIGSPLTRLFDVLRRQTADLAITALLLAATLIALVYGGRSGDVRTTLLLLAGFGSAARLVQISVALRIANVPFSGIVRPYLVYGAVAAPVALALVAIGALGSPLATTGAYAIAMIIFAFYMFRLGATPWRTTLIDA